MTSMRSALIIGLVAILTGPAKAERYARAGQPSAAAKRPNILFAIADDWSFPHAGIYGDPTVSTPVFDRVAREGARFTHAFVAAPSCTPSRAAILTGQAVHRLEEGGNLWGFLPKRFAVYPDLLEQAGYAVGYAGKGWGPGQVEPGGRARNPAGPQFKHFDEFIHQRPAGRPFCFWFGSTDPHRPYEERTGAAAGMKPDSVKVPGFLPDTPEVRSDLLDYYFEVQRFDRDLGRIIATLERLGELDNTLIIVTSDNGMPFPRAKATVYDGGARVPLAMRWTGTARPGAVVDAFVSLADIAPTLMEAAGVTPVAAMTGRSVLGLLRGDSQAGRDRVFVERERHANVRRGDLSYPVRAIRTSDYLYVRNFRPDRWPAGDPQRYFAVGPYGDIDGSPAKSLVLGRKDDPAIARYFALATSKRPAEELYDLRNDPQQLANVAGQSAHADAQRRLRRQLDQWLRDTGDPRATADDDRWDRFPYYGQPAQAPAGSGGQKPPPASPASRRPPPTVAPQSYPAEQIQLGQARFASRCGFCHGRDAAGGENGSDLTRSTLVAEDVRGDRIGPVIREGRPDKDMPAFKLDDAEMAAIVAFIHDAKAKADALGGGRRSVDEDDLQTGDAEAGKRYFNGAGGCASCHSLTGTFATAGSRFKGLALLQRMLYPGSGRDAGPPPAPPTVTVTTSAGQTVSGKLAHRDEFTISVIDAGGWTRSWPIDAVTVSGDDPLRAHREQLAKYTDNDMHDVLAYLQTLREATKP